ncbi:diiron oxygenase [Streptomyces sp. NPDC050997]|uniref:AurF N-oxygenase family protein n=1 Tax=Streptomyces sp. NPDC050997 TaxID=3155519 RepID=UPI0034248A06
METPDREKVATRLLAASVKHSLDPDTEIDWGAQLVEGAWFLSPELCSLYDTPLWDRMSQEQQIDLSRHEAACTASIGIWFELVGMQALLRHCTALDPTSEHVRYALTEIEEECRHSKMFAREVLRLETPTYRPGRVDHILGHFLPALPSSSIFIALLIAEEVMDWIQRQTLRDERVQPLVRDVMRVHVVEESRHIRYEREEMRLRMKSASRCETEFTRYVSAVVAGVVARSMIRPQVYTSVGIDPAEAIAAVRASAHRREVLVQSAEKLTTFLGDIGLLSGPCRRLWRTSGFLR